MLLTADLEIEPSTENIGLARRFVQQTLEGWGLSYPEEVTLLTSEAVTNAIVHAGTMAQLRLSFQDDLIRIAVHDDSSEKPSNPDPAPDEPGGRGMALIRGLAADWGVELIEGDGKIIWFTVAPC